MLTLDDVKHHDFSCPGLPAALAGDVPAACQVRCGEPTCLAAYQQCLQQPRCLAVHVNFDKTWGTLKTSVQDGQEIVVVLTPTLTPTLTLILTLTLTPTLTLTLARRLSSC